MEIISYNRSVMQNTKGVLLVTIDKRTAEGKIFKGDKVDVIIRKRGDLDDRLCDEISE